MTDLRLVIFDVDGTLVDSQHEIVTCMGHAFEAVGMTAPARARVLGIVGLSLDRAMAHLAPEVDAATRDTLVTAYKHSFRTRRETGQGGAPLYPGALDLLHQLHARDDTLLGIATGKSQRGLDALLDEHGLRPFFVTRQTADHHPSKPHPSMILSAMAEAGVEPWQTAMIGDTEFDIEMARGAGVPAIGVGWGYHPPSRLGAAHVLVGSMQDLPGALTAIWEDAA